MRKGLSLKKAPRTAPPKNQKSITQFFKHTNVPSTQNQQKSPGKSQSCQSNDHEKKETKRKAISPVLTETLEVSDEDNQNSCLSWQAVQRNSYSTPKKLKINCDTKSPRSKSDITKQKTPEKENSTSIIQENLYHKSISSISKQSVCNVNEDSVSRSPLTPIKNITKGEINKFNDRSNNNEDIKPKSSTLETENHVKNIDQKSVTPKKVLNFIECNQNNSCSIKIGMHPKKSPKEDLHFLPRVALLKTPEKLSLEELSPSKSGSTVKTLEFSPNALDEFGDQWDLEGLEENVGGNLDLSTIQRCEVISVTQHQGRLELRLKNSGNNRGTCFVEGVWLDTPLSPGETISVIAARDQAGEWCVGNSAGLLVLRPDQLVSSTCVVGAVFCRRKAVLQERFKGLDAGNTAMTIGILIHELVQKALTENIMEIANLRAETDKIIKQSIQMLYDSGLNEEEASKNMYEYLPPLADFMQTYVAKPPLCKQPQKDQWSGHIDKVLDIEENLCCPQLGLKGKIDATLQVTIHPKNGSGRESAVVPLELKSGRASQSASHRGQLVLYGMMLAALSGEHPGSAAARQLLLYLKERVSLVGVSCGYPERRDLLLLRNQLAAHLAPPAHLDTEELCDIEEAAASLQQRLPEPVHHHSACDTCPYLTLCSLHLWHTDGPSVSESHPLSKLREKALGHLTSAHIEYFLEWAALLRVEENSQMRASPLHALWTDSADNRSKRGTCAAHLKLKSVLRSNDRYLHHFDRQFKEIDTLNAKSKNTGPQEGDFCIVSIDGRPWIAAGVVSLANDKQIHILLERDLSRRLNKDTEFQIDTYESYATTVQNLTNLGVLLEDSERSARLRRLIIDKEDPEFEAKLPREVGRLGSKLMRSLNIEQQRAVLKALAAKDYALLRGLPGTGKTQTISVLIQMLVGLRQRVLVTAHTHSAVDTVLSRLPDTLKVMRLGSSSRVSMNLKDRCEEELVRKCNNVKELEELYASMEVVGVTCLGASHAMLSRTSFDVCIVDEATQVLQSTVLRPLFAADRFVLVGDPDQLPPVVRSRAARRLGMEASLFHRLSRPLATCTLRLQYRMSRPLARLANTVAYRGALQCADRAVAQATLNVHIDKLADEPCWLQTACSPDRAALFIDAPCVDAREKQCTNVGEACVAMAIVAAMMQGGVDPADIGMIAPFRDQVALLRRGLAPLGVTVSTVDQFQGRDKPLILYSCTKRDGDDAAVKDGEILNDQRRLAVSVTRAKHKLLVIGNSLALQRYMPLQRLIEACEKLPLDKQTVQSVLDKYKKEFI